MKKTLTIVFAAWMLVSMLFSSALAEEPQQPTNIEVFFYTSDPDDAVDTVSVELSLSDETRGQIESIMLDAPSGGISCYAVTPGTFTIIPGISIGSITAPDVSEISVAIRKSCTATAFQVLITFNDTPDENSIPIGDFTISKSIVSPPLIQIKDDRPVNIIAGRVEWVELRFPKSIFAGKTCQLMLASSDDKEIFFDTWEAVTLPNDILSFTIGDGSSAGAETKVTPADSTASITFKSTSEAAPTGTFNLNVPIYVPIARQDDREVLLSMSGDDFPDPGSALTIAQIIDPINITFDQVVLTAGRQNQVAGPIVIRETDKSMLSKGLLQLTLYKENLKLVKFAYEVTGDLKKTDFGKGQKKYIIELDRQSKAASTISFSDVTVTVDRTIPEGFYDLHVGGSAIDHRDGEYIVDDYIEIGNPDVAIAQRKVNLTQSIESADGLGTIGVNVNGNAQDIRKSSSLLATPVQPSDPDYKRLKSAGASQNKVVFCCDLQLNGVYGYSDISVNFDFSNAKFNPKGAQFIHISGFNNSIESFTFDGQKWKDDQGNTSKTPKLDGLSPVMLLYSPSAQSVPKTGDSMNIALLVALLALSSGSICLLVIRRKRHVS